MSPDTVTVRMRQLSIRSKIILTLLLTGLACLATAGIIGYQSAAKALSESVERQLIAQREGKKRRVESYIANELRFTKAVGSNPQTVEAAKDLIDAFRDMHADLKADPSGAQADTAVLVDWYTKEFLPRIDKVAGSHTPLEGLMPTDPVARRLQADYIARNPNPTGQKVLLEAAPGGSRYDAVHARYHAAMKRIADTVGFHDINVMDAATGDVVYTVVKEADFGSNMYHGIFAQSGFARAARRALDPENGGKAVIEDSSAYMPTYFAPQMFTAVPIIADGQTIGVFVAQIDIDVLNDLLTDHNGWRDTGQGETGEVQLIGEDRLMKSQSRFMATDPTLFLAQVQANGTPASTVEKIRALGTTIQALPVHNDAIQLAFRNQTGVARFSDTRGVDVVFAYAPLEIAGLRWAILAKQDVAEAFAPMARLNRNLLVAAALAAILLTFLALACARLFMQPLHRVVAGMQSLVAGNRVSPLEARGDDEFAALARGYNAMAATIEERDQRAAAAELKADELYGRLYPVGLADRMRSGAELTAETVPNVTVVITLIDGLDALAADQSAAETAEVLKALLDVIRSTAAAHGVEPVRSLGESHISVCGLSSPRLDHATFALAWTESASLAVQRLNPEWANSVSLRFGLASGEIDVLLHKRGHEAFDIWGRTLAVARRIAVDGERGSVRVSESTYALLTDVEGFEPAAPIEAPGLGTLRTWMRPAGQRAPPEAAAGLQSKAAE
jgi:class 3 adenylate cyclase